MTPRYAAAVVALAVLGLGTLPARSDEYPALDVAPLCHGITEQSTLQDGFRSVSFDECMQAEQTDRDAMIKEWSTFSPADKTHCIAEATMGGDSSYTDLVTCLEMARDVRTLHQGAGDHPPQQQDDSPHRGKRAKHKNPV